MATKATLQSVVGEAINHFQQYGFTSQAALDEWVSKIRRQSLLSLQTPAQTEVELRRLLGAKYRGLVTNRGVLTGMPDVTRATLERVKPQLRRELDRRIMASAGLIKLNRAQAVDKTLQRFAGWATSIPAGGSRAVEKRKESENIRKSIGQMSFIERRVSIDQSHKLVASIRDIVATEAGAIAVRWHSPWRRPGYNFRKDHKERDERVWAIRGCWALEKGLMKAGPNGYYDEITQVGEEVFCSCTAEYIFALRKLPDEMLTKAGMYAIPARAA